MKLGLTIAQPVTGSKITSTPEYGSPYAQPFTIGAERAGATPQCPPGYHTTVVYSGGKRSARCTPLPPAPATVTQAPAPVIAPTITVKPSFQQAFTPQFSPVMQQQQDSPGATQAAEPVQVVEAPQTITAPSPVPAPIPVAIPVPTAPSGEAETTTALRDEMTELLRFFGAPTPAPEMAPIPVPETTPTYFPTAVSIGPRAIDPEMERERGPVYATTIEKKANVWPWIIGGGLLLMMSG